MYKYTIIIPHYNSNERLNILLDSIPLDIRRDICVIVVDDHSDIHPSKTIRVKYNNLILLDNKFGKGAGGARNTGLTVVDSEWVLFADSDDWFCDNAFSILDEKSNNIDFDICYFAPCSFDLINNKSGTRHRKIASLVDSYINSKSYDDEIKLSFTHYVPWSKLIKTKFIIDNDIWFDETIIANDGMFATKCSLKSEKIVASRLNIYCVTESDNSLTKVKNSKNMTIRVEVFCRMYKLLPNDIKKIIGMNPLSLVYLSLSYGVKDAYGVIKILHSNNVSLIKYFNLTSIQRRLSRFKIKS